MKPYGPYESLWELARDAMTAENEHVLREVVEPLISALEPIARAYEDNPGASDLDNDQPVSITLGDARRAWAALRIARREKR